MSDTLADRRLSKQRKYAKGGNRSRVPCLCFVKGEIVPGWMRCWTGLRGDKLSEFDGPQGDRR